MTTQQIERGKILHQQLTWFTKDLERLNAYPDQFISICAPDPDRKHGEVVIHTIRDQEFADRIRREVIQRLQTQVDELSKELDAL